MLRREVIELARKKGFGEWTEIQESAIPRVDAGEDVLVIAPTGWGKTEVAILPILSKLIDLRERGEKNGIQALYITPLRALNRDMLGRLAYWCSELGISLSVRHGDTTSYERAKQRDNPPQLLITTPETLCALLIAPKLRDSLSNVRFVVVDEVHELVDSKRGIQLSISLERLRERAGALQVVGLSATVGSENDVAAFLSPSAKVVKLESAREFSVNVEFPLEKSGGAEIFGERTNAKIPLIAGLIDSHKKTLLFVNTRSFAEALGSLLMKLPALKEKVAVHHSSLSKESRVEVEEKFKKGELKAVVCTSSLELGIDVGDIDLVIQFVSPRQVARFMQRVGRSGHRKHLTPKGEMIAVDALDALECAVIARRAKKHLLEATEIQKNSLDVLAHGIAGLALDFGSVSVKKAFEVVKRAFPYSSLEEEGFMRVVNQLAGQRTLFFRDGIISKGMKTKLYYYDNLSTIPDEKRFFVTDAATRKSVGVLHEGFVSELVPGGLFIARGRPWRVLDISEERIIVERSDEISAAIPEWEGEEIPVPRNIAEEVGELLMLLPMTSNAELKRVYSLSDSAANRVRTFAFKQKEFFVPGASTLVIESLGNALVVHSFAGTKTNEALSRIISALLASALGSAVRTRVSPYCLLFEFSRPYPSEKFTRLLKEIAPAKAKEILLGSLPRASLYRFRFVHVAKRFGFIRKDADYKDVSIKRIVEEQRGSPVFDEAMAELFQDKIDLEGAAALLEGIRSGKVHIQVFDADKRGVSPLARDFLEFRGYSELFAPPEPTSQIIRAFKENLYVKTVSLLCTHCAKTFSKKISELEETVNCPYCGSGQVAFAKHRQAIERKKEGKKLAKDEQKGYRDALREASIISSYGKRGVAALETYGVGPETASRILKRVHKTDEDFFKELLEAQKTFVRTKRYWRA
ncbi:MAG: DEAD/DEAH box helicase [Candidatus Micrarchaeota archaeon]|nr:DEAD/DEAH box helicase [Candidatus Micrarchaeota archaeon]